VRLPACTLLLCATALDAGRYGRQLNFPIAGGAATPLATSLASSKRSKGGEPAVLLSPPRSPHEAHPAPGSAGGPVKRARSATAESDASAQPPHHPSSRAPPRRPGQSGDNGGHNDDDEEEEEKEEEEDEDDAGGDGEDRCVSQRMRSLSFSLSLSHTHTLHYACDDCLGVLLTELLCSVLRCFALCAARWLRWLSQVPWWLGTGPARLSGRARGLKRPLGGAHFRVGQDPQAGPL